MRVTGSASTADLRRRNVFGRVRRRWLRRSLLLLTRATSWTLSGRPPLSWAARLLRNHYAPWAARAAFHGGIHDVNGVRMEIPRPPDWGGGGEFHMALGTYEAAELAYVVDRLRAGDTFVDVGAHIGYFALPVARRVGPRGKVIAIEPTPASAELLRRNAAMNGFNWMSVVEAAVSDRDGHATLRQSRHSPMWNTLRHDVLEGDATGVVVASRRLDDILAAEGWPSVTGLKVDVEGAELEVLSGASELLARSPGIFLIFEVSGGSEGRVAASLRTLRFLADLGCRFCVLERIARPMQLDGLAAMLRRSSWQDSLFNVVAELPAG